MNSYIYKNHISLTFLFSFCFSSILIHLAFQFDDDVFNKNNSTRSVNIHQFQFSRVINSLSTFMNVRLNIPHFIQRKTFKRKACVFLSLLMFVFFYLLSIKIFIQYSFFSFYQWHRCIVFSLFFVKI